MTLDDWIESLFPFSRETDWDAVIAEPSSPFSVESSSKLKVFLEECVSISGISDYFEELLVIHRHLPSHLIVILLCVH